MNSSNKINNRQKALRKELAERTVKANLTPDEKRRQAGDSEHVKEIGRKISRLLDDEHVEEARELLEKSIRENPSELGFLNLKTIVEILDHPLGNFDQAKKSGLKTAELAVGKQNAYYLMAVLCNMGLVALYEGHDEFSKIMYLTAHFIDSKALTPMQNLLSWCSRKGRLEEAMDWAEQIFRVYPEWPSDPGLSGYFKKDESLNNLRKYEPFRDKVMSKLE